MPVSHETRVSASIRRTVAGIACTTMIALTGQLAAAEEWASEVLPACFTPNCLAVGLAPGAADRAAAADGLMPRTLHKPSNTSCAAAQQCRHAC
jgi:hypothetical protein